MALSRVKKEYQIPRGRLVFYPVMADGSISGGRQFGNCPGFSLSVEGEKAPHYSSQGGLREKDEEILIEVTRKASLTTDNISAQNLSLFLSGEVVTASQTQGVVNGEVLTVSPGLLYQLGRTSQLPTGVRNVSAVVVTNEAGTTTYELDKDYELDAALGMLQIKAGGDIGASTKIKVAYTRPEASWQRIKSGSGSDLKGALQLIADNAHGENRDWWFPSVSLSPSGELPLIQEGTDYSQIGFDVEVLKPDNGEAVYVDGRAALIP